MSFEDLRDLQLSDAKIFKLELLSGELIVWLKNWEDNEVEIRFTNTEGFVTSSPEGEDLSHVVFSDQIPTGLAVELDEDEDYKTSVFVSAWNDRELLSVVASDVSIQIRSSASS